MAPQQTSAAVLPSRIIQNRPLHSFSDARALLAAIVALPPGGAGAARTTACLWTQQFGTAQPSVPDVWPWMLPQNRPSAGPRPQRTGYVVLFDRQQDLAAGDRLRGLLRGVPRRVRLLLYWGQVGTKALI